MSGGGDKTEVFLHNHVDKSTKVGWADAGGSKWNVRTDGMLEPLHHLTEGVVRVFGWENNQPKLVNLGASSALTFDVPSGPPPPPPPHHHDPPPPSPPPPPPHDDDDDDDDVDVGAIVGITIGSILACCLICVMPAVYMYKQSNKQNPAPMPDRVDYEPKPTPAPPRPSPSAPSQPIVQPMPQPAPANICISCKRALGEQEKYCGECGELRPPFK